MWFAPTLEREQPVPDWKSAEKCVLRCGARTGWRSCPRLPTRGGATARTVRVCRPDTYLFCDAPEVQAYRVILSLSARYSKPLGKSRRLSCAGRFLGYVRRRNDKIGGYVRVATSRAAPRPDSASGIRNRKVVPSPSRVSKSTVP